MRLLIFTPSPGRGGVTRVIEVMSAAFVRAGIDVEVLGQRYNEHGIEINYPKEIPFHQIRPADRMPPHPGQFEWLIAHAQDMLDHLAEVQDNYDLIWTPCGWWTVGADAHWNIHTPVVVNLPDFAFDHIGMGGFLTNYFRAAARRIATRADLTIFSSDFQRQWGESHYGFERTTRIRYAMDFVPFPADKPQALDTPQEYILAFHCMGHKDPLTILTAYAFAKEVREMPPLVLAGISTDKIMNPFNNERGVEQVRRLIRTLNLLVGIDLHILGIVPENSIEDLYRKAVFSVVASRSEGDLSGAVHESVYYKTPLIYGSLPVFIEQLKDRVHGYEFTLGDPEALANGMLYTLATPLEAQVWAAQAHRDLSKRNADIVVQDHLRTFEQVLKEKHERLTS